MNIWLDDVRPAPMGFVWCKSVNQAISAIESQETMLQKSGGKEIYKISVIDCDHDLGDYFNDGGDGIKLLDWLAETGRFYPVRLHTMNPVGRANMQRMIDRYWPK